MATKKTAPTSASTEVLSDEETKAILTASAWVPTEVGQTLAGTVANVRMTTRSNDLGTTTYPIVTIKDAAGTMHAMHAIGKVLKDRMWELRPRRGDELVIVYRGKVSGKRGGQPYADFAVISGSETLEEFDWASAEDDEPMF